MVSKDDPKTKAAIETALAAMTKAVRGLWRCGGFRCDRSQMGFATMGLMDRRFRGFCTQDGEMHELEYGHLSDLNDQEDWKVMQYIGLDDMNGKRIYEGDITNHGIVRQGFYIYDHGPNCTLEAYGWFLESRYSIMPELHVPLDSPITKDVLVNLEVIGNIYEQR
jgi:uncharacterized phage protein (TIGR01671 family)